MFILVCLFLVPNVFAAMNPDLKECMQRGYEIKASPNQETLCIFPDNSNCTIKDFNQGVCGVEFMIEDYCVPEGKVVWDKDKCCEGLKPHLVTIGQATCQPFSVRFIENLKYNPIRWFCIIIFLVLIGYVIYRIKKKRS